MDGWLEQTGKDHEDFLTAVDEMVLELKGGFSSGQADLIVRRSDQLARQPLLRTV